MDENCLLELLNCISKRPNEVEFWNACSTLYLSRNGGEFDHAEDIRKTVFTAGVDVTHILDFPLESPFVLYEPWHKEDVENESYRACVIDAYGCLIYLYADADELTAPILATLQSFTKMTKVESFANRTHNVLKKRMRMNACLIEDGKRVYLCKVDGELRES